MADEAPASRRLLIDTDIGTDDAIALIMALRHPGVQVDLITTVAGNAPLAHTTRNALYVSELCGRRIPVYAGAERPLLREPTDARGVHGADGLGDLGLPPPAGAVQPGHAALALIERINAAPGACTLVTLGPLTNIALALLLDPTIAAKLRGCVVMGGAGSASGNVTAAAEFNIWADAEAARIVFRAGMQLTLVGIELCRGPARSTADEYARFAASVDPVARFAAMMCRHLAETAKARYGWDGEAAIPDAVAMAIALEPALALSYVDCPVDVETRGDLTYGETVLDRRPAAGGGNARVCLTLDVPGYKAMLEQAILGRSP